MPAISGAVDSPLLPFYGQYPLGSNPAVSAAASANGSGPQDIVDIQSRLGGMFTAGAGDAFSVSDLFNASPAPTGSIASYKVALADNSGSNGQLLLDGTDVTAQSTFTSDQFNRLHFVAGDVGSSQSLVVVAQSGKTLADGTLSNEVDSPAVRITANVTGDRSINAAKALLTQPKGPDAGAIAIAQRASIFTGFNGAARPGLTTVGNLTAAAADAYSVSDLFTATPIARGSIAGYKVALGDSSGGNGQLLLSGKDVTNQQTFSPDEFSHLHFVAGPSGSQSLVVVAQSGTKLPDGSLSGEVDSPAVQITASVTGTRSLNAASALLTSPTGNDAAAIGIAQQASIFQGFNGAARPGLATLGNLTGAAGDAFSVSGLFTATPARGGSIASYKVALGDSSGSNGQLLLNGKDVTAQQTFTPDQFSQLHFVAGASGSQSLEVVAQSGKRLADGSLVNEIDSPAVQITASVTGTRSLNAASALLTQPAGNDAGSIRIAQQTSIFTGFNGAARPGLTTVGNLTSAAGDLFSVSDLFTATPVSGGALASFKVGLGDSSGANGRLLLDGQDVTGQQSFTSNQFSRLQFSAGPSGSQSLEVVAQSGKVLSDGSLFGEIDSPAVQITTTVTGARSINAATALLTRPTGADAGAVAIAQQAGIFTGFNGAARPGLATTGNLTSVAGDAFSVSSLFTATAVRGSSIASYKVALGDSSGAAGLLRLNGKDVTDQRSFTPDEFGQLQFITGPSGSQSLEVVAQSGKRLADGSLSGEIDSPAVQITAAVTGTRSLNAATALLTQSTGGDAASIRIAQQAGIFTGFNGAARPGLSSVGELSPDAIDPSVLAGALGAFQSSLAVTNATANSQSSNAGEPGGFPGGGRPRSGAVHCPHRPALGPKCHRTGRLPKRGRHGHPATIRGRGLRDQRADDMTVACAGTALADEAGDVCGTGRYTGTAASLRRRKGGVPGGS